MGRYLPRSIRFCTAQGSGSLSGTLLAREVVPVNTDVPRVDVGRYSALRQPQRADLPEQWLLPDLSNLVLVLNQIEHKSGPIFNEYLKRFFPRFERMSTSISGGTVQFYLHESGFSAPIPATRLSDGIHPIYCYAGDPVEPIAAARSSAWKNRSSDCIPMPWRCSPTLLVEASGRMQLVVTTHSDAFVSALTHQPASIVACERPGSGTVLRRLDPEKLARLAGRISRLGGPLADGGAWRQPVTGHRHLHGRRR